MNPTCSHCRRCERVEAADFAVTGRLNQMPYRANLCRDHLRDLEWNGGLQVRTCRSFTAPKPAADALEAAYKHLCATVILDAAGLAKLDVARRAWFEALCRPVSSPSTSPS